MMYLNREYLLPLHSRRSFTLIELLIVVAIIGILAAIAVPNFMNAQVRAKVSRVQNDFRTLATAIESYFLDNNAYMPYGAWGGHTSPAYFNALSTPVAYLTSAESIDDPFQVRVDQDGQPGFRYGYFDPTLPNGPRQKFFRPGAMQVWKGVEMPGNYKWWVISRGPDRVMQGDSGTLTQESGVVVGFEAAPNIFMVYDSSNGISSIGDLHRFGP